MHTKELAAETGMMLAFCVCTAASLHSSSLGSSAAFWPANGFLTALLLVSPQRRHLRWTAFAFATNLLLSPAVGHRSLYVGTVGSAANIGEAVLVTALTRSAFPLSPNFTRLATILRFTALAVVPAVTAITTLTLASLAVVMPLSKLIELWPVTVTQETFGLLMIAPAMVVASGQSRRFLWPRLTFEVPTLFASLLGAEAFVLVMGWMPALFLTFPAIVAISFRLGGAATGLAAVTTSVLAFFFSLGEAHLQGAVRTGAATMSSDTLLQLFVLASTGTALASAGSVAEQARLRDDARRLAYRDQLTELANRRMLTEQLDKALARSARQGGEVAVLLIDLDRFKQINDTYGHQAGDELICEVARRLIECCRTEDLCSRLGGDEFVVMTTDQSGQAVAALAQRLLSRLAEPVHLASAVVQTAGSIGIAYGSGALSDHSDLMRQADVALYRVKEGGRGTFRFYETEMDVAAQNRSALETDLKRAIEEGAIEMAYQPQFEGAKMVAVEALARWEHPSRGSISPTFFIPLAEECGLIEPLGEYILRRVFTDSWRWPTLRVSINLSAGQLRKKSFQANLQVLLEESGCDARRFEFELTEGVLLTEDVATQHALALLRNLGFSLALDDFGTGYSSLNYLSRLPIDRIKIDRSFIVGLPHDKVSHDVVRAIIQLARAMGKDVIGEGIETEGQRRSLARMGCTGIQGFLTGPPACADDIEQALRSAAEWVIRSPARPSSVR